MLNLVLSFAERLYVECRNRKVVGIWSQYFGDMRGRLLVYHI